MIFPVFTAVLPPLEDSGKSVLPSQSGTQDGDARQCCLTAVLPDGRTRCVRATFPLPAPPNVRPFGLTGLHDIDGLVWFCQTVGRGSARSRSMSDQIDTSKAGSVF